MKRHRIYLYLMPCLLATACSNNELEYPVEGEYPTVISASMQQVGETRSAIDPTQYAGGHVGILWTPEDEIGVFSASVANARFSNLAITATGRTKFGGDCPSPLYAYYPYHAENDGKEINNLSGSLSASQTAGESLEGDYKYGVPDPNRENEFIFQHLFSLLRFNVNATGTALEGDKIRSLTLTLPENRKLAGDFTFNATNGNYNFTGNTSNVITLNWSTPELLSAGKTVSGYISCAPDIKEDDEVTVLVTTDRHTATFTARIAYDFAANMVITFDLTLSNIQSLVTEEVKIEETANCYMITTAGVHDFNAAVIGNGQKGIIPGVGFHTETAEINPRTAKLLWEDRKGFITDVQLRDGRVYYTTSGNVGNAVIAVYDNATMTGGALWSWHIWGVGDKLPEDTEVTDYTGTVFTVMDRALGATAINSTEVMLYQWGRKDPIPNVSEYFVGGDAKDISASYPIYNGGNITVTDFVKYPDQMMELPFSKNNYYLWGDSNPEHPFEYKYPDYLRAVEAGKTAGWTDVKTIYDPSPVGYRVANRYTWTGFVDNPQGTNASVSSSYRLDYAKYVKYDNGFYFKRTADDTEGIFFSQCGSRNCSTGSPYKVGSNGNYWNSSPQINDGQAYSFTIGEYVSGKKTTTVASMDYAYGKFARGVRCVREK